MIWMKPIYPSRAQHEIRPQCPEPMSVRWPGGQCWSKTLYGNVLYFSFILRDMYIFHDECYLNILELEIAIKSIYPAKHSTVNVCGTNWTLRPLIAVRSCSCCLWTCSMFFLFTKTGLSIDKTCSVPKPCLPAFRTFHYSDVIHLAHSTVILCTLALTIHSLRGDEGPHVL